MTSRKRSSYRRKASALTGLEALNSFKVPKKQSNLPLLEAVDLKSVDYSEEIYPQINQSFRFPQLSVHFEVGEAWFIHNKTLEDLFSQARKRLQKNPINNTITGTELNVEKIAADGLDPGNDPDTWLGQPKSGLTVNQCADLTIAREQSLLSSKDIDQFLYLILVRWVKSRAYIVSPEAEKSKDRLEPQPGYACHVSTWSRMDVLDPGKLSLEQAFHLSQVYLYEFDEDLELRAKLEHVMPYAVVKCRWKLTTDAALKLDPISTASGSILIITPKKPEVMKCFIPTNRTALLPTPQIPRIGKKTRKRSRTSSIPTLETKSKSINNRRPTAPRGENPYQYAARGLLRSPPMPSGTLRSPPLSPNSAPPPPPVTTPIPPATCYPVDGRIDDNSEHFSSPTYYQQSTGAITSLIAYARKLQANTCELLQFTDYSEMPANEMNNAQNVVGIALLIWGYPVPEYSLTVEISTFRKGKLTLFDGIFQPCLHIQRLVPHTSLLYELAGLKPWSTIPYNVNNGPPCLLATISRDQEWCIPRVHSTKASSLQSDPSPFAGYRGNYFRITLHESGGRRTEMAQFCQALYERGMAGVISMPCDESSIMFVFPECQFSQSIGIPPADTLDTNILHAILLTPHNLRRYPYSEMCCQLSTSDFSSVVFAKADAPMGTASDELFGQRKPQCHNMSSMQLKLPLNHILTTLPVSGRNLLGTTLISMLSCNQSMIDNTGPPIGVESTHPVTTTSSSIHDPRLQQYPNAHLDPRLRRRQMYTEEPDLYALATALLSSKSQEKKQTTVTVTTTMTTSTTTTTLQTEDSTPCEQLKCTDEQNQSIEKCSSNVIPPNENTIVEIPSAKEFIAAPSSPELESKGGSGDDGSTRLVYSQNVTKEIPLDVQFDFTTDDNNATTTTTTMATMTSDTSKPLSASSPSLVQDTFPIVQNISVDMELDSTINNDDVNNNNDQGEQSIHVLDKSDMDIDNPLVNDQHPADSGAGGGGGRGGGVSDKDMLILRLREPAPIPQPITSIWNYPRKILALASTLSPSPKKQRRSSLLSNDNLHKTASTRHRSTTSNNIPKAYSSLLSPPSDSRSIHRHSRRSDYRHHRHDYRRSRSPSYQKFKSKPSSYHIDDDDRYHRSPSDSRYDSDERYKSSSDRYRSSHGRSQAVSRRSRNKDNRYTHRRPYNDDDDDSDKEADGDCRRPSSYKHSRDRRHNPPRRRRRSSSSSYTDSDSYQQQRYRYRGRSYSRESSSNSHNNSSSNNNTPVRGRKSYHHYNSNVKRQQQQQQQQRDNQSLNNSQSDSAQLSTSSSSPIISTGAATTLRNDFKTNNTSDTIKLECSKQNDSISHCQSYNKNDKSHDDGDNNNNNNDNTSNCIDNNSDDIPPIVNNTDISKTESSTGFTPVAVNLDYVQPSQIDTSTDVNVKNNDDPIVTTNVDPLPTSLSSSPPPLPPTVISVTQSSNPVVDESEEGEVFDDDGEECDDTNDEIVQNNHNITYSTLSSDSSIAFNDTVDVKKATSLSSAAASSRSANLDDRGSYHHHRDQQQQQQQRDKHQVPMIRNARRMNKSHRQIEENNKNDDDNDDEEVVLDRRSFRPLQIGFILKHVTKHYSSEREISSTHENANTTTTMTTTGDTTTHTEDDYHVVDETFSSNEKSNPSMVDIDMSLEDEDMRQDEQDTTTHYRGSFHSLSPWPLGRNTSDNCFSDHDDRLTEGYKEDVDYRGHSMHFSSSGNQHHHHRPSLLGDYSVSSGSEAKLKYTFYKPRESVSSSTCLSKSCHTTLYSSSSPPSTTVLHDGGDQHCLLESRDETSSSSSVSRHISTEYSNSQISTQYFVNQTKEPTALLGYPNVPFMAYTANNPISSSSFCYPPVTNMTAGLLPLPVQNQPLQQQPFNLWPLTTTTTVAHQFYPKTMNIFTHPPKPWQ
ncbi:unnamed protein product [Trichobilharzia szidati]|nr:unnamed protein product [Trichobilharzia szidati]